MTENRFKSLCKKIDELIESYAMRLTQNEQSGLDLKQETYLRAWKHRKRYIEGTNFKSWISTIMRNTYIQMWHKENYKSVEQIKSPTGYLSDRSIHLMKSTAKNQSKNYNVRYSIPPSTCKRIAMYIISIHSSFVIDLNYSHSQFAEFDNEDKAQINESLEEYCIEFYDMTFQTVVENILTDDNVEGFVSMFLDHLANME